MIADRRMDSELCPSWLDLGCGVRRLIIHVHRSQEEGDGLLMVLMGLLPLCDDVRSAYLYPTWHETAVAKY